MKIETVTPFRRRRSGSTPLAGLGIALLLSAVGCQTLDPEQRARQEKLAQNEAAHLAFRQQPKWKSDTFRDDDLLLRAGPENAHLEVALEDQRALMVVDGMIAVDFPIASGRSSHPTPTGEYTVISKKRSHASNLYGRHVDRETGETLARDVDSRTDKRPEGARFVGAPMPYWIRLTNSGVGLHVGPLPGYPASHGCVRMPSHIAPIVYSRVEPGMRVVIADRAPAIEGREPAPEEA